MRNLAYWVVLALPGVDTVTQATLIALLIPHDSRSFADLLLVLLAVPLSQFQLRRAGVYDSHRLDGGGPLIRAIVSAQLLAFIPLALIAFTTKGSILQVLSSFFAVSTAILMAERAVIYFVLQCFRRYGYDSRNVCVVGSWEKASQLSERFSNKPQWGLRVACVCPVGSGQTEFVDFHTGEVIGPDLETVVRARVIDEVLIAVPPELLLSQDPVVRLCERYGLTSRVIFDAGLGEHGTSRLEDFHGDPSLTVGYPARSEKRLVLKRIFDIVFSTSCLILLSPLIAIIAVAVKLSSPGPVFYTQTRVGLNGRKFRMWKFRTMVDGAESMVRHAHRSKNFPLFKDVNDYRVTGVGRLLRRSSLDELPQLFNVFKGEMSIVGPRPMPLDAADHIKGDNLRRFTMPPGITGMWQVNGRNDVAFDQWMQYDLQYVDQWSMWMDAVLLFRTIPVVLTGKGAY